MRQSTFLRLGGGTCQRDGGYCGRRSRSKRRASRRPLPPPSAEPARWATLLCPLPHRHPRRARSQQSLSAMRQPRTGWDGRWDVIPCAALRERPGVTPERVRVGPLHRRPLHRLREPAFANAHPDVVAAADEVTASNDQDGVVLVLERLAIRKLTAKPASSPGNVPCASAP